MRENRINRREHLFLSIILKPQVFIPLKFEGMGGNEIRFNEFFTKISKILFVGSQIAAHTLMETGNGPNEPNTINL